MVAPFAGFTTATIASNQLVSSMPELPEVETMRTGIASVIGKKIRSVDFPRCKLKPILIHPGRAKLKRRLEGQKIVGTGRLGKRVVVELQSGDSVVFEPRMTGLVLVADPPNQTHLRLDIRLSKGKLLYWDRRGLGNVKVFDARELAAEFGPHRLGPDALTATASQLEEKLGSSSREIKVALLDQRAVAGIGNLYAAEILHLAGIHPQKRCKSMKKAAWKKVASATQKILSTAIKYEGSTLGDGTYRNALNQDGSYQNHHQVYMRAGEKCLRCKSGSIRRIVQAQRSTFFCPKCQKKS